MVKQEKKDVIVFSVGLEININGEWKDIVRYCNAHTKSKKEFHTHNDYRLPFLGDDERIVRSLKEKKVPASQMRWGLKDLTSNYNLYIEQFLEKIKL